MNGDGRVREGGDGVEGVFIWVHLNVACGKKSRGHLRAGSPSDANEFARLYPLVD